MNDITYFLAMPITFIIGLLVFILVCAIEDFHDCFYVQKMEERIVATRKRGRGKPMYENLREKIAYIVFQAFPTDEKWENALTSEKQFVYFLSNKIIELFSDDDFKYKEGWYDGYTARKIEENNPKELTENEIIMRYIKNLKDKNTSRENKYIFKKALLNLINGIIPPTNQKEQ